MAGFILTLYRMIWLLLGVFVPLILKWRSIKGKENTARFGERYGIASAPRPDDNAPLYWVHGASVGEAMSALVLAKAMIEATSGVHVLITSGTLTSAQILAVRIKELGLSHAITHQFHPYDHPVWVRRFLRHWRPDLVVMMESEIWPNMVTISGGDGIPVVMASAQISLKSLRFWSGMGRCMATTIFPVFSRIIAVDDIQKARFKCLPIKGNVIISGGSMKAAAPKLGDNKALRGAIEVAANGRMIVLLASSHDGEERIFLDALAMVNQAGGFYGVIAPRHIDRGGAIRQMIETEPPKTKPLKTGQYQLNEAPHSNQDIWIADTMGVMGGLIRSADIIVLGGGFAALGGHNPMEMAALSKGVISGAKTYKNTAAFTLLQEHGGVIIAETAATVGDAITMLAASPTALEKYNLGAEYAYNILGDSAMKTALTLTALSAKRN